MPSRIAIVDEHLIDQDPDYRSDRPTWVTGARNTLLMTRSRSSADIPRWICERATALGTVDVDLLCHGGPGTMTDGSQVYILRVGTPGIYLGNVDQWTAVRGSVRKIRVFSCGVLSPEHHGGFDSSTGPTMQHTLMRRLARAMRVTVKYSLQTAEFGMTVLRTGSQSYNPDHMMSPVYTADSAGRGRLVR